jgi:hypothetical protein
LIWQALWDSQAQGDYRLVPEQKGSLPLEMGFGNYLTGAFKGRLPHLLSCKCFIALTLIVCGPPKSVEYKVLLKHI